MPDWPKSLSDWLLGSLPGDGRAGPSGRGFVSGSPGLLERLAEWYPGDPTGPHAALTLAGVALAIPHVDSANGATCTIEVAPVRVRFDGAAATATVGLLLPPGSVINIGGKASLNAASFFTTAAGGIVQVAYWT